MTDTNLLNIPPFLSRIGVVETTDGVNPLYYDARPPKITMPKIASQRKRRRKTSLQVKALRHLDYPPHRISKISEEEAIGIIRRGESYVRQRKRVTK